MFYKVTKNENVIDVLQSIRYVKYQKKHDILLLCDIKEAEAILSSNGKYGWHIAGLYNFAPDNNTYDIKEIPKYEYDAYKKALELEVQHA